MKIISFNVNGIRAITKKDFFKDFESINPDILCIQETKAQDDQVAEALGQISDYHLYSNSAEKKGYSGTAILTKEKPINVSRVIGNPEHDNEGRVLCLDYRQSWDLDLFNYLKGLEEVKPVIICGDFNVCHKAIDLARPKPNYNKSAGYMQEEIDGMDRFVDGGFIDTFRHFNPDKKEAYSWWSYRGGARGKNVGWRLDYFLVSNSFMSSVKDSTILTDIHGSDHCPVCIELS